jgi:uncharacterized protein (TIGR02118 family)
MFKISVMYPNTPGARFDHTYYRDVHMPMVAAKLGAASKYYTVEKGLGGGAPGTPATYIAMCHFFCDSLEALGAAMGKHQKEIVADVVNYTDQTPILQASEIIVDAPAR